MMENNLKNVSPQNYKLSHTPKIPLYVGFDESNPLGFELNIRLNTETITNDGKPVYFSGDILHQVLFALDYLALFKDRTVPRCVLSYGETDLLKSGVQLRSLFDALKAISAQKIIKEIVLPLNVNRLLDGTYAKCCTQVGKQLTIIPWIKQLPSKKRDSILALVKHNHGHLIVTQTLPMELVKAEELDRRAIEEEIYLEIFAIANLGTLDKISKLLKNNLFIFFKMLMNFGVRFVQSLTGKEAANEIDFVKAVQRFSDLGVNMRMAYFSQEHGIVNPLFKNHYRAEIFFDTCQEFNRTQNYNLLDNYLSNKYGQLSSILSHQPAKANNAEKKIFAPLSPAFIGSDHCYPQGSEFIIDLMSPNRCPYQCIYCSLYRNDFNPNPQYQPMLVDIGPQVLTALQYLIQLKSHSFFRVNLTLGGSVLDKQRIHRPSVLEAIKMIGERTGVKQVSMDTRVEHVDSEFYLQCCQVAERYGLKIMPAIGYETKSPAIRNGFLCKKLDENRFISSLKTIGSGHKLARVYVIIKPWEAKTIEFIEEVRNTFLHIARLSKLYDVEAEIHVAPMYLSKGTRLEKIHRNGGYNLIKEKEFIEALLALSKLETYFWVCPHSEGRSIKNGDLLKISVHPEILKEVVEEFNRNYNNKDILLWYYQQLAHLA